MRGEACEWPGDVDGELEAKALECVVTHSVEALVYWRLSRAGTLQHWPERLRAALVKVARDEAALEVARLRPLRDLLSALAHAGVDAILFKGAALAYTRYAHPWLRPRNDADVLVRVSDRQRAMDVLDGLGYECGDVLKGDLVGHQAPFRRIDRHGLRHDIDLHWRISNRPLLADMLTFDELWGDAILVDDLGPTARAAGDVHALLIACVHPVVHHRNGDNLLWWHDVHLLSNHLRAAQFEQFVETANSKRVAAICASSLTRASKHFGTRLPDAVRRLTAADGEDSARYLLPETWRGDIRISDFRSLAGWRSKIRLIREVALPEREYMLRVYNTSNPLWTPALHVHRLARGTWRLLDRWRRGGTRTRRHS